MATENAKKEVKDVQVNVGKDLSTVTLGNAKIEVSADGKKVVAYTNDGVETKAIASAGTTAKGTQFSISEDFNAVVLNGVTIEQAADGHLVITAPGGIVINKPAPANDSAVSAAKAALEIGDVMKDGTIYAGISPTTNQPMYAAPKDAPVSMDFNAAAKFAKKLEVGDKKDFRVPSKEELNVLFQNREKGALKGTFNLTGSDPDGWYWSSSPSNYGDDCARCQRLSDGSQSDDNRSLGLSVRPVRS